MDELVHRFFTEMIGRIDGPMSFRLILQPAMALYFAFRDGRQDAVEGQAPYGWAIFSSPEHRRFLLADGWKGFGKVFVVAFVLDIVYQYVAIRGFRPLQAVTTACILALLPYILMRGPFNRLCSRRAAAK